MILYKKAGVGLPIRTEQGNLAELQGNDSLSTAAGRATHAARGFGPSKAGYSVVGDTMNDGKRSLQFKFSGSERGVNKQQLMAQTQKDYLSNNPTSANIVAPDLNAQYIDSRTTAPLPAATPKKPLMSQNVWQESRDKARRNTTIAPVQSQSTGILGTSVAQSTPLGLDGQPTKRKYLGSYSF